MRRAFFPLCFKVNLVVNGVCRCRKARLFIRIIGTPQTTEPGASLFQVRWSNDLLSTYYESGTRLGVALQEEQLARLGFLNLVVSSPPPTPNNLAPLHSGREWKVDSWDCLNPVPPGGDQEGSKDTQKQ